MDYVCHHYDYFYRYLYASLGKNTRNCDKKGMCLGTGRKRDASSVWISGACSDRFVLCYRHGKWNLSMHRQYSDGERKSQI